MNWTIYKHTSPTGKVYVGQTRKENPNDRWQNGEGYKSNVDFYHDICLYGWDAFTHEILESGITSQEQADKREVYWIKIYKSFENGYNRTPGGHEGGYSQKGNTNGGRYDYMKGYDMDTQLQITKENRQMIEDAYDKVIAAKGAVSELKEAGSKVRIDTFSDEKGREQNRMYGEYLEGSIKENFEERVALVEEKIRLKQEVAEMKIQLTDERAAAEREIQKKLADTDIEIQKKRAEAEIELEKIQKRCGEIKKDKIKHTIWKFLWPALGVVAGVVSYALMFIVV